MNTENITIKSNKLPNSRVEITVTIPIAEVTSFRSQVLKELKETTEIDGFRKGHAPELKILERVGEMGVLAEMADRALTESYPTILEQSKIQPISRPTINITKMAPDNDVEYVITTDVMPTVIISDVVSIAKEHNQKPIQTVVTDTEVENAIREIRQMRAHQQLHDNNVEHHDHNHQNIPDDQLPELTDDYVKTLGKFSNIADFEKQLRENMEKEKQANEHEKRRIAIIEAIITKGEYDIPVSIVDFELEKMTEQFKHDLSMNGMKLDEYLNHIGKTIEDMKIEWREQAEKRVQMQLTLEKIAETFTIKPDQEKIDTEVTKLMEMYSEESIQRENVVNYVTQILTNTAVFDWLENQK